MSRFAFQPSDTSGAVSQLAQSAHAAEVAALDSYRAAGHAAVGAAQAIEHSVLGAAAAGAAEISPMIQLIMRMPGQIGLLNSMFEALGNFILPHTNLLAGFDPSVLGIHDLAHAAGLEALPSAEHMAVDPSLLPADAPIFQTMQGMGQSVLHATNGHSLELLSSRSGSFISDVGKEHLSSFREQLNVSGQLDLNKPQFEAGRGLSTQVEGLGRPGEALSGPSLTEANPSTHLAGANRLFSDRLGGVGSSQSAIAQSTPPVSAGLSQSVPLAGQSSVPSALNVNASSFGQQAESLPAVAQMNDVAAAPSSAQNVGYSISQAAKPALDSGSSTLGPSSAVSDQLGGHTQLASNQGVSTFRPTVGSMDTGNTYDAAYLQGQQPAVSTSSTTAVTHGSGHVAGLKAKALSLDGAKDGSSLSHAQTTGGQPHHASHAGHPQHSHAMDQIAHRGPERVQYDNQPHHSTHTAQSESSSGAATDAPQQNNAEPGATGTDATQSAPGDAVQTAAGSDATVAASQAPTQYTIRAGDCLWNIAKDHLGSATKWTDIYKMNTDLIGANPDLIHPGTTIQLPGSQSEVASALEAGKYIVKPGDNLWSISKNLLGDGQKWGEIYHVNSDLIGANPRLILPGQELSIPGVEGASTTVAQASTVAPQQVAQASAVTAPSAADMNGAGAADAAAPAQVQEVQLAPQAQLEAAPKLESPGPGAAAAATLPPQPVPQAVPAAPQAPSVGSVVTSSLAPDLASFLKKGK